MTHLHAERIVWIGVAAGLEASLWTLRLYDEPDGYARRLPYDAIATATIVGEQAWLAGLHGQFSRAAWRTIRDWLRSKGVTSATMERRGRVIVLVDESASNSRTRA